MYDSTDSNIAAILLATLVVFGGVAPALAGVAGATTVDGPANPSVTSSQAATPTEVTECRSILEPGRYVLDGSIGDTTDEVCLFIGASDVVLDGAGNTVDGDGGEAGVGVSIGESVENVTVRNLTVTDFGTGVEVDAFEPRDVELTGLTVRSNGAGVEVRQGARPTSVGAQDEEAPADTVRLSDSEVGNNAANGVTINGVPGLVVERTVVADNGRSGIVVQNADRTTIRGNTVSGNDRKGVFVIDAADVSVINNTLSGSDDGIQLGRPPLDNEAASAGAPGATIADNTVLDHGLGIRLFDGSEGTTVRNNTIRDVQLLGMRVRANGATVRNNVVTDSGGSGVVISANGVRVVGGTVADTNSNENSESAAISVVDANGVTVEDVTVEGDNDQAFSLKSTGEGVSVSDLRIEGGATPVTVSFSGRDVALSAVDDPPAPPSELSNAGGYLRVDPADVESPDPRIDLSVSYDDVPGVDESSLRLWRFQGSDGDSLYSSDFDYSGDPTDRGWIQIGDTDDRLFVEESVLKGDGETEEPNGAVQARFTRRIDLAADEPFEVSFDGLRNGERFYGLRLLLSTAETAENAWSDGSTGYSLNLRQRRSGNVSDQKYGDVNLSRVGTEGSEALLTLDKDHGGEPVDVTLRRQPGDENVTVLYNGERVGSLDGSRFAAYNYLTVQLGGPDQSIDGIRVDGSRTRSWTPVEGSGADPESDTVDATLRLPGVYAPLGRSTSSGEDPDDPDRPDDPEQPDDGADDGSDPAPEIELSADELQFGGVQVGNATTRTVTVRNDGESTLSVREPRIEGTDADAFDIARSNDGFTVDPDAGGGFTLGPGESREVTVRFAPSAVGDASATLRLVSPDSSDGGAGVALAGRGTPNVTVAPVEFGRVATGNVTNVTLTVRNRGAGTVDLTAAVTGPDADAFAVPGPAVGLGPGESREVTVRFAPSAVGDANATLALRAGGATVATTGLRGTGALPGSRLRVTPERLSFLNVSAGETTTRTVTVENAGTRPLGVGRPEVVGVNASAFEVVDVEVGAARLPGTRTAARAVVTARQPGGFVLQPGEAREVAVRFRAPDDTARTAARLRFPTNDTVGERQEVTLSDSRTAVDVSSVQTDGDRTTVTVRVTDATAGERLAVDLSRSETEGSRVAVDRLTFTPLRGGNFTVSVTNSPDAFATTPSFDLADGTRSAGYFRINTTLTDAEVRDVAIRFRLRGAALAELDGEPEDVALYRFTDRWTELPTEAVASTDSHRIFRALSPGFSDFSSGVKQAQFEIADARVTLTRLGTGEATEVIARVRNTGGADGTFIVRLQQGQQVVARRELTIAPDGTRQATFDRSFDSPGSYQLFVNDQFVANVTVEGGTTARPDDDGDAGGSSDGDGSGGGALPQPGMGIGAAVLAVLTAGYAVARRRG
jgi:parallel beta-helix repeat protein